MHTHSLRFYLMVAGVCVLLFIPLIFVVLGQTPLALTFLSSLIPLSLIVLSIILVLAVKRASDTGDDLLTVNSTFIHRFFPVHSRPSRLIQERIEQNQPELEPFVFEGKTRDKAAANHKS